MGIWKTVQCDKDVMQTTGNSRREVHVDRSSADYWEVVSNNELKDDLPYVPRRRRRKNEAAQFGQSKYNVFECQVGETHFRALTLNLLKDKIGRSLGCHMIPFSKVSSSQGDRILLYDDQGSVWLWGFIDGIFQTPDGDKVTVSNGCVGNPNLAMSA